VVRETSGARHIIVAGVLVKSSSMSFGQKQQHELWSKATGTFVKSSKSNDIERREDED